MIPNMFSAVFYMHMAVQEIFRIVFFYQGVKYLKPTMWQIFPVVEPEGRSVELTIEISKSNLLDF